MAERGRAFLSEYYLADLGEYAYRNGLDFPDLRIEAKALSAATSPPAAPATPHRGSQIHGCLDAQLPNQTDV